MRKVARDLLASPARAGELVTLSATGLGPYRITIREGLALPAVPLYPLDAVVELYAGETPLPLEWAGGHPGQVGMALASASGFRKRSKALRRFPSR